MDFIRFSAFESAVMRGFQEYKDALRQKKYGLFSLYTTAVFVSLILLAGALSAALMGIGTLFSFLGSFIPDKPYAPKTLSYHILERTKDEDGLHRTLFEVFIYNPPGNTNDGVFLILNFGMDTECQTGSDTEVYQIAPGVASATKRRLFDCITREKIIDNGRLFSLGEEAEVEPPK